MNTYKGYGIPQAAWARPMTTGTSTGVDISIGSTSEAPGLNHSHPHAAIARRDTEVRGIHSMLQVLGCKPLNVMEAVEHDGRASYRCWRRPLRLGYRSLPPGP